MGVLRTQFREIIHFSWLRVGLALAIAWVLRGGCVAMASANGVGENLSLLRAVGIWYECLFVNRVLVRGETKLVEYR